MHSTQTKAKMQQMNAYANKVGQTMGSKGGEDLAGFVYVAFSKMLPQTLLLLTVSLLLQPGVPAVG
jgi:hypothetical protein